MQLLQYWLKARVLSHGWHQGCLHLKVDHRCDKAVAPWKDSHLYQTGIHLGLTSRWKVVTTDACEMGSSVRGHPGIRLLVQPGEMPAYQQPRNDAIVSGSQNLPASPTGVPQHDDDGLHKS